MSIVTLTERTARHWQTVIAEEREVVRLECEVRKMMQPRKSERGRRLLALLGQARGRAATARERHRLAQNALRGALAEQDVIA